MANSEYFNRTGFESTEDVLKDIKEAVREADDNFPTYNSQHEALGVLREEYLELEAEIFKKQADRNFHLTKKEARQLAACCVRLIRDCCDERRGRR